MRVENVKIHDLGESFKASKYPMTVAPEKCTNEYTSRIKSLGNSKGGHDQFLSGVLVSFDLTCSNKMWIEAERYKYLVFVSSQSTMHRISKLDIAGQCNEYVDEKIIERVEELKDIYNQTKDTEDYLRLLYNVPSGFELTARLTTNYRCLKNVWEQRHNHKLPEWREFCKWIEKLPYFKEMCLSQYFKEGNNE